MTSPASPPQPPTAFLRATLATYHLCAADIVEQTGLTAGGEFMNPGHDS